MVVDGQKISCLEQTSNKYLRDVFKKIRIYRQK